MMLISIPRLIRSEISKCASILGGTPKLSLVPTASLTSKENRDPNYKRPEPWDYENRFFRYWHAMFLSTTKRFDENTKVIVVDGNIGAGKTAFTKALAEAFDLRYIPEPTMDPYYTTPYGYDLRKLDPLAPPSYKVCELSTFYKNPHDRNVTTFQYRMYMQRYEAYIRGLAHVLNTGTFFLIEKFPLKAGIGELRKIQLKNRETLCQINVRGV